MWRRCAHVTLPQTFTQAGYFTYTCGKVYHDGSIKPEDRAAEFNEWGPAPGMPRPPKKFVQTPQDNPLVDWGVFPENDEDQADWKIATAAIEALNKAPRERPFFVACGFRLPHVPCYASQRWFDLYPEKDLQLPPVLDSDRDDTPRFSWYLHWKLPEPRLKFLRENNQWTALVRAYLASISFMDSQVGRVLEALAGDRPRGPHDRGALVRPRLAPGREADHRQEHALGTFHARAVDFRRNGNLRGCALRANGRVVGHLPDAP